MDLYCIIFGIVFLAAAVLFFTGNAPNYIKAWRLMSEKEKSEVKIKPLCINAGCVFIIAAVIFFISGFISTFRETVFIWCMIFWLVATGVDVAFITKSKRYVNANLD